MGSARQHCKIRPSKRRVPVGRLLAPYGVLKYYHRLAA
jgi:hypothetical protein